LAKVGGSENKPAKNAKSPPYR